MSEERGQQVKVTLHPILGFRDLLGGVPSVVIAAETLGDVFRWLATAHPRLHEKVVAADGGLRDSVLLFVNDQQIAEGTLSEAKLEDGDSILLVPSIAGG